MARRLVAMITDHANLCAGYKIVDSEFVVETLLGPVGSVLPKDGMEKLKTAMTASKVQSKSSNGVVPLQPLDMKADEVDHLLRMLRFAVIDLTNKADSVETKAPESVTQEPVKELHHPVPTFGKWAYLDIQRRQSATVYQSPYAPGFGFSQYAKREYGLTGRLKPSYKESLANDFFAKLSPEDQEKIIHACGNVVTASTKEAGVGDSLDPDLRINHVSGLGKRIASSMDPANVDDHHLSVFDITLRADSPASSFGRAHIQYQSPQDFSTHAEHESSILPRHLHDHHDLFGDQQANQRFWQRSAPWVDGDNQSHDDRRPLFGPHERPGHDYASSDMDVSRGPGSLHSMDMAGFGFDGTDDPYPDLSP
jgi:hypothetical protein